MLERSPASASHQVMELLLQVSVQASPTTTTAWEIRRYCPVHDRRHMLTRHPLESILSLPDSTDNGAPLCLKSAPNTGFLTGWLL